MPNVRIRLDLEWEYAGVPDATLNTLLPRLLAAIEEGGTLREAVRRCGISYRHGWGVLEQAATLFGRPVVLLRRGRGSRLTPLGELLLRHHRQAEERLRPQLRELEQRLEAELAGLLGGKDRSAVRLVASHDLGLLTLRELLAAEHPGIRLELQFRGSLDSLLAWRAGEAEVAGFHLPAGTLARRPVPDFRSLLDPRRDCLLLLAHREQGLMVMPDNPLGIGGLADLLRPGLRFVNRQPGSGSRLLLDRLLQEAGIGGECIPGYDNVEFTHLAVAALVASGDVDAGFGIRAAAARFGLGFIPLARECYYLALRRELLEWEPVQGLVQVLSGTAFHRRLRELPGYDPEGCGALLEVSALDPSS